MSKHRQLVYGTPIPQDFLDAIQEFISTSAPNLNLAVSGSNTVQIVAGPGNAQVSLGINGLWRYISASVNATVTGAAGTYDIFATTGANSFAVNPSPPPAPPETDSTDYTFALAVVAHGQTPTATNYRKIGEVIFDGSRINGLRQMVGNVDGSTQAATGDIKMTVVQAVPAGWLRCDGSAVSRATYAALFAALGGTTSIWGQGDGSTTFNLPDFRSRTPIGAGQGAGLSNRVAGSYGGGTLDQNSPKLAEERHVLVDGEMPIHGHGGSTGNDTPDHAHNVSGGTGDDTPDHVHYIAAQTANGATDYRQAMGGYLAPTRPPGGGINSAGYASGTKIGPHTVNDSASDWGSSDSNHQHAVSVTVPAIQSGGAGVVNNSTVGQRHQHPINVGSQGASTRHQHPIPNDGGGNDHQNMPPWVAVPYLVKT